MAEFTGSGLRCTRGERVVFEGVGFTLNDGGLIELRGANGSGKSSLLRMMAGLLPPAAGSISWSGTSIAEEREAHHARVAYIGHLDAVKGMLTVAENLKFWMAFRSDGAPGEARYGQALAAFKLIELADTPARFLSAGQRRRVALARLLVCPAALWLLDEPATALDTQAQAALDHAMAAHMGAGGMVVMATHEAGRGPAPLLDLDEHALLARLHR